MHAQNAGSGEASDCLIGKTSVDFGSSSSCGVMIPPSGIDTLPACHRIADRESRATLGLVKDALGTRRPEQTVLDDEASDAAKAFVRWMAPAGKPADTPVEKCMSGALPAGSPLSLNGCKWQEMK